MACKIFYFLGIHLFSQEQLAYFNFSGIFSQYSVKQICLVDSSLPRQNLFIPKKLYLMLLRPVSWNQKTHLLTTHLAKPWSFFSEDQLEECYQNKINPLYKLEQMVEEKEKNFI